ncbi:MAG: FHA domain-containing protein [Fimbriimonadaceae bacterium]|jgi:pSer/pThr/pTyr-binding forkhead associated (FHA) protein|nr:FHA domain-containing protein [Fimbriimonadaceae bacterium]
MNGLFRVLVQGAIGRALAGFLAGALVWLVVEPMFPKAGNLGIAFSASPEWVRAERALIVGTILAIGLACGFIQGLAKGSRHHLWVTTLLAAVFTFVGGMMGWQVSGVIFQAMMGAQVMAQRDGDPTTIVRVFTFIPLGIGIGLGLGVSQLNVRGAMSGAFGGLIGGAVTGMIFNPISTVLGTAMVANANPGEVVEIGAPGRAVLTAGIGLLVGLFTALAEQASRRAWVRLVVGRNEGRDWPIDNQQTLIGRDERAGIPLFGDGSVAPHHATIVRQGGQYLLMDAGTPAGIGHNGIRVPQAVLQHGDTFQIGGHQLQFFLRGMGRPQPVAMVNPGAQPAPMTPIVQNPTVQNPAVQPMPQPMGAATVAIPAQPAATSAYQLVVLSGPMAGHRQFRTDQFEIGREGTGLRLTTDSQASRRHCLVSMVAGQVTVTDLNSTNGTYINGQRVTSSPLRPGDVLRIGGTEMRLENPVA